MKRFFLLLVLLCTPSAALAASSITVTTGQTSTAATYLYTLASVGTECTLAGSPLFPVGTAKECFAFDDRAGAPPTAIGRLTGTGALTTMTATAATAFAPPSWATSAATDPTSLFHQLTDGTKFVVAGSAVRTSNGLRESWLFDGDTQLFVPWGVPNLTGTVHQSWINDVVQKALPFAVLSHRGVGAASWFNGTSTWTRGYAYDGSWRGLPQTHLGDQFGEALDVDWDFNTVVGRSGPLKSTASGAVWFSSPTAAGFPFSLAIEPSCNTPGTDEAATAVDDFSNTLKAIGGTSCGEAALAFTYQKTYATPFLDLRTLLIADGVSMDPGLVLTTVDFIDSEAFPLVTVKGSCTSGASACSYTAVTDLPEPGTGLGLTAAAGLLGFLKRRKEKGITQ